MFYNKKVIMDDILFQINEIFKDVLDDPQIVLTFQTTAKDVKNWDSLTHIQLVVAIEKHFKIRFTSQEIFHWKDVGAMIESIGNRLH
jgi:acyl carrier protein